MCMRPQAATMLAQLRFSLFLCPRLLQVKDDARLEAALAALGAYFALPAQTSSVSLLAEPSRLLLEQGAQPAKTPVRSLRGLTFALRRCISSSNSSTRLRHVQL